MKRTPRKERPRCPVICPDGHRCRARVYWPKGAPEAAATCCLHLGQRLKNHDPEGS